MWIAKDMLSQQFTVTAQLRLGIQTTAGVIEIDMTTRVKTALRPRATFISSISRRRESMLQSLPASGISFGSCFLPRSASRM
jgi:hypothetical protein